MFAADLGCSSRSAGQILSGMACVSQPHQPRQSVILTGQLMSQRMMLGEAFVVEKGASG
jgi:hypothetical protein